MNEVLIYRHCRFFGDDSRSAAVQLIPGSTQQIVSHLWIRSTITVGPSLILYPGTGMKHKKKLMSVEPNAEREVAHEEEPVLPPPGDFSATSTGGISTSPESGPTAKQGRNGLESALQEARRAT